MNMQRDPSGSVSFERVIAGRPPDPSVDGVGPMIDGTDEDAGLTRRTASGVSWQVLASLIKAVSSFAFGIVLARLLPPEDFGIIGIAMIATGLVQVVSSLGLGTALIQRREIDDVHVRVCHTLSFLSAVLFTLILFGVAGPIAAYFNEPRVAPVLRLLSLGSVLAGFSTTAAALLTRRLAFKTTVKIELVASILGYGAVAVTLAALGYGYWSLVGGMLTQAGLASLLMYAAQPHSLRPLISIPVIRDMAGFSFGVSLTTLANYAALKGDYFVIGRLMNAASVGYYTRAYALMELPLVLFGSAVSRVLFSAAARVQEDLERFRRAYLTTISLAFAISLPVSLAMAILASELIAVLYGETWIPAVPALQILSVFGMFRMTYNTASAFVWARGQAYRLLGASVVYGFLVVGASWWGATRGGLAGVAWGVGVAITVMWLLVIGLANAAAGVTLPAFTRAFVSSTAPGFGIAIGLAILVHLMRLASFPPLVVLLTGAAGFAVALVFVLGRQVARYDLPEAAAFLARIRSPIGYIRSFLRKSP
jgi:O-antigen/teichoic acid export membrane protein